MVNLGSGALSLKKKRKEKQRKIITSSQSWIHFLSNIVNNQTRSGAEQSGMTLSERASDRMSERVRE